MSRALWSLGPRRSGESEDGYYRYCDGKWWMRTTQECCLIDAFDDTTLKHVWRCVLLVQLSYWYNPNSRKCILCSKKTLKHIYNDLWDIGNSYGNQAWLNSTSLVDFPFPDHHPHPGWLALSNDHQRGTTGASRGRFYLNRGLWGFQVFCLNICMIFRYMGVSENRGTPKWMVYNGKPY